MFKNLPDSGPVIVIDLHEDSCDALALLLDLDEPLHIPLDKFSYAKATDLRNKLNAHLRDANVRMRDSELDDIRATRPVGNKGGGVIKHILHQLQILVVKPIQRDCELDDIRSTRPVGNKGGGVIKHILHQLWILVVKPILDGLGISVSTLGNSAMLK